MLRHFVYQRRKVGPQLWRQFHLTMGESIGPAGATSTVVTMLKHALEEELNEADQDGKPLQVYLGSTLITTL